MFADNLPLTLGVCGFATVCGGVLLIGAFLVLRFGFGEVAEMLGVYTSSNTDDDLDLPRATPRGRVDLRDKAESLDFDSAVQRYQQDAPGKPRPRSLDRDWKPETPPSTFDYDPPTDDPPRRRRRQRYDPNEIHGGMDTDGDGWFEM